MNFATGLSGARGRDSSCPRRRVTVRCTHAVEHVHRARADADERAGARSCVSQKVPRTVAAAYFPFVVKFPLPFPHRLRTFGFGGVADTFRFGQASGPDSVSVVTGVAARVCPITARPG